MDKYSSDLLKNKKEFSVEKFTYATTVNMPNSHYHDHYEILYIIEGKRKLTVNNAQEYILDSNNIALIKPYIVHGSVYPNTDG